MSYYFRPPNSREQNLFIIRTSIDDLTYTNFTGNILNNVAYSSPSNIFLPPGFSLSYNSTSYTLFTLDYTNAKYEIPPTVSFQIKFDLLTLNSNGPWYTSIVSVTNTQTKFYIYSLQLEDGEIIPRYPNINNVDDSLLKVGLQMQIIGRTMTGPTFAIANQGWTYVESTNPSNDTIYSAMPVGTNGVIPSFDLTIGGSYGYLGGAGNGGNPSTTSLQNYTPTEVMNNISNYYFFPIKLGTVNEVLTLPSVTNIGQEIVLLLNQNPNNTIQLTISTTNTTLSSSIVLQNEGDMVKFVALNKDGVGNRWVKINNK
jgi:hypothetical protein